mmetsp:Transcript_142863/g.249159  ORF Transcript_142863/g.249159 Transcript_142863/m.249159 type:complete len:203 (+) Transcript_142863:352-960(+)
MIPRMVSPRCPMTEPNCSVGTRSRSSFVASCRKAKSSKIICTTRTRCSSDAVPISTTRSEASKGGESASFICTFATSRSLIILLPFFPTIQAASSLEKSRRIGVSRELFEDRDRDPDERPEDVELYACRSSKCSCFSTPPAASSASTSCSLQTAFLASSAELAVTRTRFWSARPGIGSLTTWRSQAVSSMRLLIRSPRCPIR